jgi:hypothetical protein
VRASTLLNRVLDLPGVPVSAGWRSQRNTTGHRVGGARPPIRAADWGLWSCDAPVGVRKVYPT